ncbi:MAG: YidC/Oxa1 family membrane protein insertase [Chloroflexota bacterium]
MDIGAIWDLIILRPMINVVIGLSDILFSNFGLTIIALTIVVRGALYPLTRRQLKATKAMQSLQPKIAELQKKHGKDKQKLAQEQMRLYKESGVNPAGCLGPMLIQMPIWIALYQAIIRVLAVNPESFLNLSRYLYDWPVVYSALPLNNHFLWMDLASPNLFIAILVGATMWAAQKMITPVTSDPKQRSQSQMMTVMMPLMFAFLALTFPSGLALYWMVTNLITIIMQYFTLGGWGSLFPSKAKKKEERDKKLKKRIIEAEEVNTEAAAIEADITSEQLEEGKEIEAGGEKRQDTGKGYTTSPRKTLHKPKRGRSKRPKRR